MRRENTCDPSLKHLNDEINSDIHKQNLWKEHIDAHWYHRHNTHILWKAIHSIYNRAHPRTLNTSKTFNNKIITTPKYSSNCFTKQFTNTVRQATDPLTEQHRKYKHITLHSPQLWSKRN